MQKEYNVIKLENEKYDYLVLVNTIYIDPIPYASEIMNHVPEDKANLLFDFLLRNGTTTNRLISVELSKDESPFNKFKIAEDVSDNILAISSKYFQENPDVVDKGTIPDSLKSAIKEGLVLHKQDEVLDNIMKDVFQSENNLTL